jgi:hydrogenase maturation protease
VTGAAMSDTATPNNQATIVVLGVGNLLLSDEGVGVHVVHQLMKMALPPGVAVIEGGVYGLALVDVVAKAHRLIVIDAVRGGGAPGTVYRFGPEELSLRRDGYKMSVHEIGILEVIRLAGLVGQAPQTTIIGVEPRSLEMGMELSPELQAKVPRIIELVVGELESSA